jgi:DNA-binding response OmpR family regulator
MRTVAVVDDDADAREAMEDLLARRGYGVLLVGEADCLMPMLAMTPVDLIVMDVMMPKINGLDLCRAVKESPELRHIPVMLVSGLTSTMDVSQGLSCGAVDYLKKPIEGHKLMARIRAVIGPP